MDEDPSPTLLLRWCVSLISHCFEMQGGEYLCSCEAMFEARCGRAIAGFKIVFRIDRFARRRCDTLIAAEFAALTELTLFSFQ